MKRSLTSSLTLAIFAAALSGCGAAPKEAPAAAMPVGDPVAQSPRSEAESPAGTDRAAEASEENAASGEGVSPKPPPLTPLGVPECDTFVRKYVACVDLHAPADEKERLMTELNTHRARWRELANMQEGKVAAGLSCRGVGQRLKGDLIVDYGCEF